jgi:rRNA maturation RNase YbeY
MRGGVDIRRTVRVNTPGIPFSALAERVLGKEYALSLVLCGDHLARRINTETRKKTYSPNVLSFPLDTNDGEIILNVRKAMREAGEYGIPPRERIAYLFVHGLCHLGGMNHGRTMEDTEQRVMREFHLTRTTRSHSTHAKSVRRH